MTRDSQLKELRTAKQPFDILVVGGGATGLGIAVDAAARGYSVALFEQADFAKGSSSRSTKLIHGGVRYLQQGNVSLVMEALKERGILLKNAPHLVHDLEFIVPSYRWWSSPFYGIGLKVYDLLAGRFGFGHSEMLSKAEVVAAIPTINQKGLLGGVKYFDGQFDDARLAINLATTAVREGALVLNYMKVTKFIKSELGQIEGVEITDSESGETLQVLAKVVINATGAFTDSVRRLDRPSATPVIVPSQGVHLVFDREVLKSESAIMVPQTSDGRVLFAIPWHDVVVVGTTDTPIEAIELEPKPFEEEIEFILETASEYLSGEISRSTVRSVFTGIRPLVRSADVEDTSVISRDHVVLIDPNSGLLTIAGGKWTTYRHMAEEVVDQAAVLAELPPTSCRTASLPVHGYDENPKVHGKYSFYGSDAAELLALERAHPEWAKPLCDELDLTEAQVRFSVRSEWARRVEDVLSRRTRCLLRNAQATKALAARVATIVAEERGETDTWAEAETSAFSSLCELYGATWR